MSIEVSPREAEMFGDWYEATLIIKSMRVNEHDNWRLPTLAELIDIYKQDNDFTLSNYWSSDEAENFALAHSFSDNSTSRIVKTRVASIRAVRDAN
jgi:hypothetical protein